jgi:hypothetical protein
VTNKVVVMVWYMGQGEGEEEEEEEDLGSHHTMAFKLKFFFFKFSIFKWSFVNFELLKSLESTKYINYCSCYNLWQS